MKCETTVLHGAQREKHACVLRPVRCAVFRFHRCLERVLGCPAGSGSSGEGLRRQARLVLGEIFSVAVGYDDNW